MEDEAKYFIGLRQKGKSMVSIGFKYCSEREAFLKVLNAKKSPWDLHIDLWESQ